MPWARTGYADRAIQDRPGDVGLPNGLQGLHLRRMERKKKSKVGGLTKIREP